MDEIPILIGRQMRLAEKPAAAEATPEETEALVRETLGAMEEMHRAQDRWIALGKPSESFDAWQESETVRFFQNRAFAATKLMTDRIACLIRWLLVAPFILYPWKSKETLLEFWMWPLAAGFAMAWLDLRSWQKRVFPGLEEIIEERGCAWLLGAAGMVLAAAVGKTWWMGARLVAVCVVGCPRFTEDSGGW